MGRSPSPSGSEGAKAKKEKQRKEKERREEKEQKERKERKEEDEEGGKGKKVEKGRKERSRSRDRKRSKSRKRKSRSRRRSRSRSRRRRDSRSARRRRSRSRKARSSSSSSRRCASPGVRARVRARARGFDEAKAPGPLPEDFAMKQVNAMNTMMSQPPAAPNPEVEAFLMANPVQGHAAHQLRNLPMHLQCAVLARGSLSSARDKTAVLTSRISDALAGSAQGLSMAVPPPMPQAGQALHPGIENLIMRYQLDGRCAQKLRSLAPDQQALAAQLPMHEARNPSAFVMSQIQLLFSQAPGQPVPGVSASPYAAPPAMPGVIPQPAPQTGFQAL